MNQACADGDDGAEESHAPATGRRGASSRRGRGNGVAASLGALCRGLWPPANAWVFAALEDWGPYGRYAPLLLNCVLAVGSCYLAKRLPAHFDGADRCPRSDVEL